MKSTSNPDIIVHVLINKEHFSRFSNFQALWVHKRYLGLIAFTGLLTLFGLFHLITGSTAYFLLFTATGFLVPAIYLIQYKHSVIREINRLRLNQLSYDAYTIQLGTDGVMADNRKEQVFYFWQDIRAAYKFGDCTYLYYTPKRALILPDCCIIKGTKEELWELLCIHMPKQCIKKWRNVL